MKKQPLQVPGAGLPTLERWIVNLLFRTRSVLSSDKSNSARFERELNTLLEICQSSHGDTLATPKLIPRIVGIEDSSRNWSVLMVLDHLNQVNQFIAEVLQCIANGQSPPERSIADFKPRPIDDFEIIEEFETVCREFLLKTRESFPLGGESLVHHPWFGELDAHQWHCLAALHMGIHRKQARKILALIGVT